MHQYKDSQTEAALLTSAVIHSMIQTFAFPGWVIIKPVVWILNCLTQHQHSDHILCPTTFCSCCHWRWSSRPCTTSTSITAKQMWFPSDSDYNYSLVMTSAWIRVDAPLTSETTEQQHFYNLTHQTKLVTLNKLLSCSCISIYLILFCIVMIIAFCPHTIIWRHAEALMLLL